VGPLPSTKNKWHIHNALNAKIIAGLVHNGERGFQIHIVWLYNSSLSQSYRGFTGFGGECTVVRAGICSKTYHKSSFASERLTLTIVAIRGTVLGYVVALRATQSTLRDTSFKFPCAPLTFPSLLVCFQTFLHNASYRNSHRRF
jgi:hypothetical protein